MAMTGSGQRTIQRPTIGGRAITNDGPPFRVDDVGSLIRSQKLIDARDVRDAGTLSDEALHEIEDEPVLDAIAMQERVGLHSITDGELRQFNWRDGFFESVDGFSEECVPSSFIFTEFSGERRRSIPIPVAIGKLRRKKITADDFAFTQANAKRTAKATLPSPTVNHFFFGDNGLAKSLYPDRRAFFADVAEINRDEIADLAAAGCRYLQIDDVTIALLCDPTNLEIVRQSGEDPDELIANYIDAINDAVRGRPANMTVCVHMCRGNQGHGQASGGYEPVAERLFNELEVGGFFLEYDTERAGGFEPLRFLPKGKSAALGLISTKLPELESSDALTRRVEEASNYPDIDQLRLCPQCGFASSYKTTRFSVDDEERKLAHMVKVADEIWH